MKIEKAKNEVIKSFDELAVGDAFILVDHFTNDICIKTYEFDCDTYLDDCDEEDCRYNAFQLRNGHPVWFDAYTKVVVPNCKVVVE